MDRNSNYYRQVQLLTSALPYVARETCFALKGGTAINLFHLPMPRLSVKRGQPKWDLFPISDIEQLPSVQWKLMNIEKMPVAKHKKSLAKLEGVLSGM